MENSNDSRPRAVSLIEEAEDSGDAIAAAIIYLGDRISEIDSPDLSQLATEIGGIATSISDLAAEVAHK